MSAQKQISRRSFIKNFFAGVVGFTALPLIGRGLISSAQAETKACSTSEPIAQAIGYVEKAKDKKKPCSSCIFYSAIDKKTGNCQLMPNCAVPAGGSCNSFQKKA